MFLEYIHTSSKLGAWLHGFYLHFFFGFDVRNKTTIIHSLVSFLFARIMLLKKTKKKKVL